MKVASAFISLVSIVLAASDSYSTATTARRERNLDHLNAETLAYYLGIDLTTLKPLEDAEYVGYDVAIMFYAQWDQNSHSLAPYWDSIGTKLRAGSKSSKLIMGLFNCELDREHVQLCNAAGIKHYPTMLFIGSGDFHDTDFLSRLILGKDRAAGPAGASALPRTVKFQGNWQYTDSLKDWIRTMQGLSAWHRMTSEGFLKNFRRGLLGLLGGGFKGRKQDSTSLPVGVPVSGNSAQVSLLQHKLDTVAEEGELMEKVATHASLLLDNMLFPPPDKDAFAAMKQRNAWSHRDDDLENQVFYTCVTELSLDYCSRLSTRVASDYIMALQDQDAMLDFFAIEIKLKKELAEKEEYCAIFDECQEKDFKDEKCRPDKCPFQQPGCNYVTACFDDTVQKEYAMALDLITEKQPWPPTKLKIGDEKVDPSAGAPPSKKTTGGGWGFGR